MRINKVTTKTGDTGTTLGPGCKTIAKNSDEIEFLGSLDELNSNIGELNLYIEGNQKDLIKKIQNDLFDIGAHFYKQIDIKKAYYEYLENFIEEYQKQALPLSSFLLPQGSIKIVKTHIVRALTRRVERDFYNLNNYNDLKNIGIYLNRLSDVFFILLRNNQEEITWDNNSSHKE